MQSTPTVSMKKIVIDIPVYPQYYLCNYICQVLLLPSEKRLFLMGAYECDKEVSKNILERT